MKDQKEYNQLCNLALKYNHYYYVLDQPLVSDAEYDALLKKIVKFEADNPNSIRKDSPTLNVGGRVAKGFSKVKHDPPMMSLDNIFSEEGLQKFIERCQKKIGFEKQLEFSMELKFDGLAVEAVYLDGQLQEGSTRGNGLEGERVTDNLKTLKDLPKLLHENNLPKKLAVRGEVYMTQTEFERLNNLRNKRGEDLFANPRNAAAGSLRLLDYKLTAERDLKVAFYGLGEISSEVAITSQKEMVSFLEKMKIPTSSHFRTGDLKEIKKFYYYWLENRHSLGYDIDGIVIKINDFKLRELVGTTNKFPRWAIAWKFPAQEAITKLESVDYQIGRTGVVTPVANLQPINIGGVLVKRATLHNFKEVARLGFRIGDLVKVIRAGDVIPKITEIINEGDHKRDSFSKIIPPLKCPSCQSTLQAEGAFYRCLNLDCEAIRLENLKFFVSKSGLDIEFFGPELISKLYQKGFLKDLADFYKITLDDLLSVERMGEKLAIKIINSINEKRKITLGIFLKSLGIRNVGQHVAKRIAEELGSLSKVRAASSEELMAIADVGPEGAKSIFNFFNNFATKEMLDKFQNLGVEISEENQVEDINNKISGKNFVFTGKLTKISRGEAEKIVQDLGGYFSNTVSQKTDLVVAGENPGSKFTKAQKLAKTILSEDQFLELVKLD